MQGGNACIHCLVCTVLLKLCEDNNLKKTSGYYHKFHTYEVLRAYKSLFDCAPPSAPPGPCCFRVDHGAGHSIFIRCWKALRRSFFCFFSLSLSLSPKSINNNNVYVCVYIYTYSLGTRPSPSSRMRVCAWSWERRQPFRIYWRTRSALSSRCLHGENTTNVLVYFGACVCVPA